MLLDAPAYPRMFKFPTTSNTNMADAQTCEVRATLALLNTGF
jgi:hypothetical protein